MMLNQILSIGQELKCTSMDYIDYVQIIDGELQENKEATNIREAVALVTQVYKTMAKVKGLKFDVQFS